MSSTYLAFRRELEKMFDIAYNQNKSIREIESVDGGDAFWHRPVHMLTQSA